MQKPKVFSPNTEIVCTGSEIAGSGCFFIGSKYKLLDIQDKKPIFILCEANCKHTISKEDLEYYFRPMAPIRISSWL